MVRPLAKRVVMICAQCVVLVHSPAANGCKPRVWYAATFINAGLD